MRPVSPRALKIWLMLLLLATVSTVTAGEIVLKNGKVIRCQGPYEVKGSFVAYKDKEGSLYRLPLKVVDLERSRMDDPAPKVEAKPVKKEPVKKPEQSLYDMVGGDDLGSGRTASREISDEDVNRYAVSNPRKAEGLLDRWEIETRMRMVYAAVLSNKTENLKLALMPGLPLNEPRDSAEPVLYYAVRYGSVEMVKALLRAGANPNVKTTKHHSRYSKLPFKDSHPGDSMLHTALRHNKAPHLRIAQILVKAGANVDARNGQKITPLWMALQNRNAQAMAGLVKKGADVNVPDQSGIRPLFRAIEDNNVEAVAVLFEGQVQLGIKDKEGQTPLLAAVQKGNQKIQALLVDNGAAIHQTVNGHSPLILAAKNEDLNSMGALLALGANPNQLVEGLSPGLVAVRRGSEAMLAMMEKKGLDPNAPPLLPEAVKTNRLLLVKMLLAAGADADSRDDQGDPALVLAARGGNPVIVDMLLEKGADVYQKGRDGQSAFRAAEGPHEARIKQALRAKFKP